MYGFKAVKFQGKKTARKALSTLEDYAPAYAWCDDVAVVSRNHLGLLSIHSTWSADGALGEETGWGLITGGLVGLLFGPAGAAAGAAMGGSFGAMFGAIDELAFDDPVLADFAGSLERDTSALVLVGKNATLDDFASAVEPLGGTIVSTDIDEKDMKALRAALKHTG
ncbi:DUF1269 domain-containing protein [Ruegeria pomeroyi]|uniref:DUF1269 domain-containing protein n=2 Tax=Ruegeria TaxID=97050 RepID=A0A9Q3WRR0_9RHOB|nr:MULTISPECIES: DUF1269 domain-containing protein [Ruegeria]MCE8514879.1 DUF1269 domain-containing protein [Ruegeria pomeroyi]MCE8523581.1 DUF1269 domain-containing protein [Ruegeria pomeroyi]MCE8531568.1 DUF1269 domain-containing protein [Ruegeria pomeroyi]MCE8535793.1 DUF1269 domain-containing protein [Ruegeria pomeroyi]MCE8539982.1 DUF1269 domain-containing protein [Ruegeria pomeroyi]